MSGFGRTVNKMEMVPFARRQANPDGESGSKGNGSDGMTINTHRIPEPHRRFFQVIVHSNHLISSK